MQQASPRALANLCGYRIPTCDRLMTKLRKLHHVILSRFNGDSDSDILSFYRGHSFKIVRCEDRLDILIDHSDYPTEILLEPMTHLISRLSRCSPENDTALT